MSKQSDCLKNQRIQVFARCRPLNSMEKELGSVSTMEVIPEMNKLVLKDRKHSKEYYFDQVFSPASEQVILYEAVVGPLIEEVLNGYSCTVFVYGQTGTGKTYTMEGERSDAKCSWRDDPAAGIIPRSLHHLFEELKQAENVDFSVKVSFFEIYNEEVYDLLSSSDFTKLRLYEDTSLKDSVKIQGLEEVLVESGDDAYAILEKGAAKRHTAETKLNACSSRSHTVFTVTVGIIEETSKGVKIEKNGKLNLVDLAGSENARRSGAIDKRLREAGNINQSLLTLGRVITALIEKQAHVPYRESKLTRILQYSLGGHAKTSIIATISPALCNLEETVKTLDYAAKAKMININPEINRKNILKEIVKELTKENERLRCEKEDLMRDLCAARRKSGFFVNVETHESMIQKVVLLEKEVEVLKAENSKLHREAVQATNDIEELHEKVRRTQAVVHKNEDICDNLRTLSQKQCAELYDMVAAYSKERIELSKRVKEDQDRINSALTELKRNASTFCETFTNNLQFLLHGFSSHLNEQSTGEKKWVLELSQDLKSIYLKMIASDFPLCLVVTNVLQVLQMWQVSNYKMVETKFTSRNSEVLRNMESNKHKVNVIITSLSSHVNTELKYLEDKCAALLDISGNLGTVFDKSGESLSNATSQLQTAILEKDVEIENFISEAFVKDVPTGATPQQRTIRGYCARSKISTPLKENEESGCTAGSSFLSSQDVSCGSDNFDSVGCGENSTIMKASVEEDNCNLNNQVSALRDQNNNLKSQLENVDQHLTSVISHNNSLQSKLAKLEVEITVVSSQNKTLAHQKSQFQTQMSNMEEQIKKKASVEEDNCNLINQVSALRDQNNNLKSQLENVDQHLTSVISHNNSLQSKLAKLEVEIETQMSNIEEQIKKVNNQYLELESRHRCLGTDHESLQRLHEQLTKDYNYLIKEHSVLLQVTQRRM